MLIVLAAAVAVATAPASLPADPNPPTGVADPAVTDATAPRTLCVPNWTAKVRPPASYTNRLKRQQLPAGADLHAFEEDHIWPIEDGGDPRDPENLRPQAWDGPSGARAKDQVENAVHRAICVTHTMTIAQGHAVLKAWILAHRPYPTVPQPSAAPDTIPADSSQPAR